MPGPIAFSVIVPAYNREHLIGDTLAAIFAQTHPPAEVIVVDDGSTDATADVVRRWPACTLIVVANAGAANARHVGVAASTCPWLAFCDSDDLWRPDHLERIAAAIAARPDIGFLFTDFVNFDADRWRDNSKFAEAPTGFWQRFSPAAPGLMVAEVAVVEELLRFQPIFPSCTAMTRQFYDAVGGYDATFGRLPSEDLEFTLRCVMRPPVAALLHPSVGIRRHPGNHSADHIKQLWGEVVILAHSKSAHGVDATIRAALDEEIAARTAQAIDGAFASRQWPLLPRLIPHLPRRGYSARRLIKIAIGLAAHAIGRLKRTSAS